MVTVAEKHSSRLLIEAHPLFYSPLEKFQYTKTLPTLKRLINICWKLKRKNYVRLEIVLDMEWKKVWGVKRECIIRRASISNAIFGCTYVCVLEYIHVIKMKCGQNHVKECMYYTGQWIWIELMITQIARSKLMMWVANSQKAQSKLKVWAHLVSVS